MSAGQRTPDHKHRLVTLAGHTNRLGSLGREAADVAEALMREVERLAEELDVDLAPLVETGDGS
jgi:hypothetical protein